MRLDYLTDIVIHVNEDLDETRVRGVECDLCGLEGVIAAKHIPGRNHVLMVTYDNEETSSHQLADAFEGAGASCSVDRVLNFEKTWTDPRLKRFDASGRWLQLRGGVQVPRRGKDQKWTKKAGPCGPATFYIPSNGFQWTISFSAACRSFAISSFNTSLRRLSSCTLSSSTAGWSSSFSISLSSAI